MVQSSMGLTSDFPAVIKALYRDDADYDDFLEIIGRVSFTQLGCGGKQQTCS